MSRLHAMLLVFAVFAATARAETPRISPSEPVRERRAKHDSWVAWIDAIHADIGRRVIGVGEGIDSALCATLRDPNPEARSRRQADATAGNTEEQESDGSLLRISPRLTLRSGEGLSPQLSASGRLKLPNISERLNLIFSGEDDSDLANNQQRATLDPGDRRETGSAELRYEIRSERNIRTSFDAGLRLNPEPVPRLGPRLRVKGRLGEDIGLRYTQRLFWDREEGFGQRATVDVEQKEPGRFLRIATTSVYYSDESDGIETGQSVSHYWYLSNTRVIGLRAGISAVSEPSFRAENYTLRAVTRKRIHRDWMFLEIEPGIDFPRDEDFDAVPFVQVKVDILFGDWNANGKTD